MEGKVGTTTVTYANPVASEQHPPIISQVSLTADSGVYAKGTLLARKTDDTIAAYVEGGADGLDNLIGVLTKEVDTSSLTTGSLLKHGMAFIDRCNVGGSELGDTDIAKLESIGIYPAHSY